MKDKIFCIIVIVFYIGLMGMISAFFSVPVSPAYDALNHPSFTPSILFFISACAIVILFAGVGAYLSWREFQSGLLNVYALIGAFCTLWIYVFFAKANLGFAFAIIIFLIALSYYLIKKSKSGKTKLLLLPFLFWIVAVLIFNYAMIILN